MEKVAGGFCGIKLSLLGLLCLNLPLAQAKHPYESEQEVFNRVAIEMDTIFVGRVLKVKTIKDGLVYANGDTLSIGIMEEEVLKVYRGEIHKGDKLFVCTWFDGFEYAFGPSIGNEAIIFGIKINNKVLVPSLYGYFRRVPENEATIYKALKLKRKKINAKADVFMTYFEGKIIGNACNEQKP
ncbi:hypothetical protein [Methylovulum psychrotolerans]|uniref:Uncharacterized protein n=1 Tax=Methylovulum psychrotolerans TaxID=1704499 RepID=A0A2S5CFH0_9GAMM|nr:hypothetical protein [Methylovulum psychrotolerans]POZ49556.1 hypothetical protein AADEFJLK_04676 [Methylovulum psychrotolerans]